MVFHVVRKGRREDSGAFLRLLLALARFEKLVPPSEDAQKRIISDIFAKKRLNLFVAEDAGKIVGYALYFYSYSSFLAKPVLYLEDLFVLKKNRKKGLGFALFRRCAEEAIKEGCGRMEWAVLDWNENAISFYEKTGAKRLDEWHYYRLAEDGMKRASGMKSNGTPLAKMKEGTGAFIGESEKL